jgi:hypothetical protein
MPLPDLVRDSVCQSTPFATPLQHSQEAAPESFLEADEVVLRLEGSAAAHLLLNPPLLPLLVPLLLLLS